MPAPCEVAVKSVIPAIRAYVAKELASTYKMKQTDVALVLGITQTAVSKYVSNVRVQAVRIDDSEEIRKMMDEIASKITDKMLSGPELIDEFCTVCNLVRQKGLMCSLCERYDSSLKHNSCRICMSE